MSDEIDVKRVISEICNRQQKALDILIEVIKNKNAENMTLMEAVTQISQEYSKTPLNILAQYVEINGRKDIKEEMELGRSKMCESCKHGLVPRDEEPCLSCNVRVLQNWEKMGG